MNILIAGIPADTKNYERALSCCQVSFCTELHPESLSSYDKLLLPGGGDIHPSWFGQKDLGSTPCDPALDRAQFALLLAFVLAGKPVLGICRGMQMINVFFGGDLIQDLPTKEAHAYHELDQVHLVRSVPSSLCFRLYGPSCLVNSAHHQGCGQIGTGLTVTQTAPDGVIEALEHQTQRILGLQWHPERTKSHPSKNRLADGLSLIRYFAERL